MTEAIGRFAPEMFVGITPKDSRPNHAQIPPHLIDATGELGLERGDFVETRVQNILASRPGILEVIRHGTGSEEDMNGRDLTVRFNGDSPVDLVYIQVKSSRHGLVDYKQAIRNRYFPNDTNSVELVRKWLTENRIILINGSQIKSDEEILKDSFYPQLERIQQKALIDRNIPIQVFPETQTA